MALCTDKALTYLNQLGYNVIRLPRKGIEPLDVLGRDSGGIASLGRLDQVWTSNQSLPLPKDPQPAADIDGQRTGELSLSLGLQFLGNVLRAIGAEVPELSFAFKRANKLQFAFSNVVSVSVAPLSIGNFLAAGDLNANNPIVQHYFLDPDNEAFVITEVLKSNEISAVALDSSSNSVTIDVPSIKQVVGAKVEVSASDERSAQIKFKGLDQVTFGFKAFAIAYNGKWQLAATQPSGDLSFDLSRQTSVLLRPGKTIVFRHF